MNNVELIDKMLSLPIKEAIDLLKKTRINDEKKRKSKYV